jgi:PAS domain S-box-containing protein
VTRKRPTSRQPRINSSEFRNRLHAAEEALRAIREGEVDALVVERNQGDHVITLAGAELAYRVLFDQMNEGAVTLACDGVIAYCNQRFAAMVRLPLAQVVGAPLSRFVQPLQLERFATLREEGSRTNARGDLGLLAGDGSEIPVAVSFAPLHAEGGVLPIGVVGVIRDISERKQHDDLRSRLIEQVMSAQDEERRRIARELHDETGQSLTALLVGLRTIEASRSRREAAELARRLRETVARTLEEVGRLSRGLHPSTLDDVGLAAAVTRHVQEFEQRHEVATDVRLERLAPLPLPPLLQTTVYRVLQEALTNVARHAEARRVRVELASDAATVERRVEDDGVGLQPAGHAGDLARGRRRLGLQGMRERAALLGGSVEVESQRGAGTTITARFPLPGA